MQEERNEQQCNAKTVQKNKTLALRHWKSEVMVLSSPGSIVGGTLL
jgi:hypothetical protein